MKNRLTEDFTVTFQNSNKALPSDLHLPRKNCRTLVNTIEAYKEEI